MPGASRRRRALTSLAVAALFALLAGPVALGAAPPQSLPGQRIDMRVLLIGSTLAQTNGVYADSVYGAWRAQLERTGVPFTSWAPNSGQALDDAFLADYGANRAKFQAVITSQDNLLNVPQATALAKLEETFAIRQISDNVFPSIVHGLNAPVQFGEQGGTVAQLTVSGKAAFPYLKGPVPLPPATDADGVTPPYGVFGYQATPAAGANFTTLLTGPGNAAYLGVNVRADGTEEMVNTVAGNQFQSHHQFLRDGMLAWVTRGIYLGYARNYLGLDVDDVFLPDDKWDPVNNVTDFSATIRMDAGDVADMVAWQNRTGIRLNMAYNMFGIVDNGGANDPLLQAFKANKNAFRWINHTYSHPNLDCTTAAYTTAQIRDNQVAFEAQFAPLAAGLNDPSELITGEHSGLANTIPGNPGTIDPPVFDDALALTGGTLLAGSYEYGITASTAATAGNETPASTAVIAVPANGSARLTWESLCKATSYKVYRRTAATATVPTAGPWELIGSSTGLTSGGGFTFPGAAFSDAGPAAIAFTDTGAAGTAAAPPLGNSAVKAPYAQNPGLVPALTAAGIRSLASDTSKPYPSPATSPTVDPAAPSNFAPGSSFPNGPAQTVPRYPTNLYYNVAERADQLDEYNYIYLPPALGGVCVATATNTCRTAPATWAEYVDSEVGIMFGHVVGNDPRPHYFHQTNVAQYEPTRSDSDISAGTGGTLFAVVNALLARYDTAIDRASTPLVQLSQQEAAQTLVRQAQWRADVAAGRVAGYIQDGAVHVVGQTAMQVPVTGTTAGTAYAGTRSGWIDVAANADTVLAPADPVNTVAPAIAGTLTVGGTLTATAGTWTGTGTIATSFQWQRSTGAAAPWTNIAGATAATYVVPAADENARLRVVVSARNAISSYSQAASAAVDKAGVIVPPVVTPPVTTPPAAGSPSTPAATPPADTPPAADLPDLPATSTPGVTPPIVTPRPAAKVVLSRLRMAPRAFAPTAGSTVRWTLNRRATVRLTVQRLASGARIAKRWVAVGTLRKAAPKGAGSVRLTGRIGGRRLAAGRYRLVVRATAGAASSPASTLVFTVRRG